MATTNDLKNGLVLNIDGQLWTVVEFQHVKPGKGPAFVRTKPKAGLSGTAVDKTFAWGQVGIGSFDDTSAWDDIELRGTKAEKPADR